MPDETISTSSVDPADREAYWRHVLGETFAPVLLDGWDDHPHPSAQLRGTRRGPLLLAELAATPHVHRRTEPQIKQADSLFFQVAVLTGGSASLEQDGRTALLAPGDFVVYENARPFTWRFHTPWEVAVLSVPADEVRLTPAERTSVSARTLSGTTGLAGVVARFVRDTTRHAAEIPADDAGQVLGLATDLVVALLAASSRTDRTDARHRTTMARITGYITDHLRDPTLGPEEIAAAAHISTRLLHKLFEREERTVALYVRDRRLHLARRELLDPHAPDRSVAAIAHGCGFGDVSGFTRAFRSRYGTTPGALRASARATQRER
ncbi:helix-turn-helix domain-containing protein [Leifsonia aquatica]|uniref:AraC-like ligand-binding domain-containing protein n=1 Tax=Leifsonia aquatica TaxID=144185 RepID=UPI000A8EB43E|nr:helix-turn-helix domain-containing protein [Leifsonia aquatica]